MLRIIRRLARRLGLQEGSVSPNKDEIVYLVGPSRETNGGIGYVIGTLLSSNLGKQYRLVHIVTHRDGNRLTKAWCFIKGLLKFMFWRATEDGTLVHVNSGYGPSLSRKWMVLFIS